MNVGRLALGQRVPESYPDIRRSAVLLALALLTLNFLDLIITRINIQKLGGVEINGLIAPVISTPWAAVLKLGTPLLIILLAVWVESARMVTLLRVAVGIYVVIAIIGVGQFALVTM
jgi:hypothetical protein